MTDRSDDTTVQQEHNNKVLDVSIEKKILSGKIVVKTIEDRDGFAGHQTAEYVFPYNRLTGKLKRLRLDSHRHIKRKSWVRTVQLVPEKVWEELDEQDYNILKAEKVYKEQYGEELL